MEEQAAEYGWTLDVQDAAGDANKPVSYTHLDVYKRQQDHGGCIRAGGKWTKGSGRSRGYDERVT